MMLFSALGVKPPVARTKEEPTTDQSPLHYHLRAL